MIDCTEVHPDTAGDLKLKYPYIGKSGQGKIVLFYASKSGVLLDAGGGISMDHATSWREGDFTAMTGPVVIRNITHKT